MEDDTKICIKYTEKTVWCPPILEKNCGNIILVIKSEGNDSDITNRYQFSYKHNYSNMKLRWAQEIIHFAPRISITNHGSLNQYESNVLFTVFHPMAADYPYFKGNIGDFLDEYTPKLQVNLNDGTTTTIDRLSINHPDVFVNSVRKANKIFMRKEVE
jgi:hypothetical protein